MNRYIESLNWRYATKKFDSTKKISDEDLNTLMEAVRLSASSYGLQPYHVLVISNGELRNRLKEVSWGQSQITDASHLIVFANKIAVDEGLIDTYLTKVSETRNIPKDGLSGYGDFMKSKLLDLQDDTKVSWTGKQTYLALGNLLSAAATLKIDACPMEGFDPNAYNEILGLKEKGLNTAVVATVGYRSHEDETQHYRKVRQSKEELFTHIL
ncbi:MAG: NAD(P)H-dependent oxidoreductase [Bacteroidota bacterium]